jgi:hypothetical protein
MSEPERPPGLDVEGLVRAHLDRHSERIDPRPLFARIAAGLPAEAAPIVAGGWSRGPWRWVGVAAVAASVALWAALSWQDRKALARGETVVREARQAHQMPIDRCYLVEVRRESPAAAELTPTAPQVRVTRLWTRGDRFWVESTRPDQRWAWGRDQANRFWIAFGPHTAARLEADEVPDWLNLYCDLHSLHVEQLLGDVLGRFDLAREASPPGSDASTIRVVARARVVFPRVPSIESADLEIDAETRVIRRMVVRRSWNGQPFATVTYRLAETDALDPSAYQIEGHLTDPSEVFTRDHEPQRRKELLARWFGPRPGRGSRPVEPPKSP